MSASTSSSTSTITLVANNGEDFKIARRAIRRAGTVETLIEALNLDDVEGPVEAIPLPEITKTTLKKIVEYCEHEIDEPEVKENEEDKFVTSAWVKGFLDIDSTELYHLFLAANYLNIPCLLRSISRTIALMIREKSVEDIRRIYNIENDFTPEEEDQIKKENAWCEL